MRNLKILTAVAVLTMGTSSFGTLVGNGDGLIKVQVINSTANNPGNNTGNWLAVWNELDNGAGPTGVIVTPGGEPDPTIQFNTSDTETVFDYDIGGNFGVNNSIRTINNDGPGGGPGPFPANDNNDTGSNYSVRGRTFIEFHQGGDYTIQIGSDDGRHLELTAAQAPGYAGFSFAEGQNGGAAPNFQFDGPGDTSIGFNGGTGHANTRGVFNVNAGDILSLEGLYYEGGGGDSGEIAIFQGANFDTGNGSPAGFELLQDSGLNGAISLHSELINVVPEPTTAALGLIGMAGLMARRRRAA